MNPPMPHPDAAGAPPGQADAARERLLAGQLAELETLYRTAPVGLAVLDTELRYVRINEQLAALNRATPAEHIGRTVGEMVPAIARQAEAALRRVLDTGEPLRDVEFSAEDAGSGDIPLTCLEQWHPLRAGDGRIVGIAVSAMDITERKRMAQALQRADRQKNEFLAILGHELRNPLAPILSAAQALRRADAQPDARRRLAEAIERQTLHMKRLLDDLLEVSHVARGELALRPEPVSLRTVLRQVADAAEHELARKRQRLSLVLPEAPLVLHADPTRLRQMLSNLLNNASKYTPAEGRSEVQVRQGDGEARIRVIDSGVGLAPEDLQRVFELFARAHRHANDGIAGLGIGLALVKRLAELHGGSIRADSDGPGRGATFTLALPLAEG